MKRLLLSALFGLAILTACEKTQKETVDHASPMQTEQPSPEMVPTPDEHMEGMANMELDNGKKWKTNAEMLPFINEQEKLLKAFDDEKDDYKVLAAKMNAANEKLIKSCTMKGKSHDILHVWLTDHMKNIELLAKAANKEEADQVTDVLEHSMESYHQYFE